MVLRYYLQLQKTWLFSLGFNRRTARVLYGIYRLGEKSPVTEGLKVPRGVRGHVPPGNFFWNEYALRCNLVHFETQFWEMVQCVHWPRRVWMIFWYSYLYTVMITIFFWGGVGGRASTPQIPWPMKFGLLNHLARVAGCTSVFSLKKQNKTRKVRQRNPRRVAYFHLALCSF